MANNFFNRESNNTNRRKLKIVSQTDTEFVADIERADDNVVVEGSPINAETFNGFETRLEDIETKSANSESISKQAKTIAIDAESTANSAIATAESAEDIANTAIATANQASSDASNALTKATYAVNEVAKNLKTITINGTAVDNLYFDSDPQSQINSKASQDDLDDEISAREEKDEEIKLRVDNIKNNTDLISNADGGFSAGFNADASGTSIALGLNAKTSYEIEGENEGGESTLEKVGTGNVAIGEYAQALNRNTGKSVAIGYHATAGMGETNPSDSAVAIGDNTAADLQAVAIGKNAKAFGTKSSSLGYNAYATAESALQLGDGTNSTASSLQFMGDNIYNANSHTLTVQNIELNGENLASKLEDLTGGGSGTGQAQIQLIGNNENLYNYKGDDKLGTYSALAGNAISGKPTDVEIDAFVLKVVKCGENEYLQYLYAEQDEVTYCYIRKFDIVWKTWCRIGVSNNAGGFAGGLNARLNGTGGAIGKWSGVFESTGEYESEASGFAGGYIAQVIGDGGAVGKQSISQEGSGVIGSGASGRWGGGAVGYCAHSSGGGAIGKCAVAGRGFAGGENATTYSEPGVITHAIQLGEGNNPNFMTLQIYDDNIYDARTHTMDVKVLKQNGEKVLVQSDLDSSLSKLDSIEEGAQVNAIENISINGATQPINNKTIDLNIPAGATLYNEKGQATDGAMTQKATTDIINGIINNSTNIVNSQGGFSAGESASTTSGGVAIGYLSTTNTGVALGQNASSGGGAAIGYFASAEAGGSVGQSSLAGNGFAGGYNAKTLQEANGQQVVIDAIQLGTGTNNTARSLQIYDDNIYDANTHTLKVDNAILGKVDVLMLATQLWNGNVTSGQFTLNASISDFDIIILEGIQGASYPYIISTVVIRNGRSSMNVFLGANGSSNSYNLYLTLSGNSIKINSGKNAHLMSVYGIK